MILINKLYLIIFITYVFCFDVNTSNHLDKPTLDYIYLSLESHNRTTYLLDYSNPNLTADLKFNDFIIDGSMSLPIFSLLPQPNYTIFNDTLVYSQISAIQDHRNNFYDTSFIFSNRLRKNLDFFMQFESKSYQKRNYGQKGVFSITHRNGNSELGLGYMYSYFNIISYTSNLNTPFDRSTELFNLKLNYKYDSELYKISNLYNNQISDYGRYDINYQSNTIWNEFRFEYLFSNNYSFRIDSKYKFTYSVNEPNNKFLNNHYLSISPSIVLEINNLKFNYGFDIFKYFYEEFYIYSLKLGNFLFGIENKNFYTLNLSSATTSDPLSYKMNKIFYNSQNIFLKYSNQFISNQSSLNLIKTENDSYLLLANNSSIEYNWLNLIIDIGVYDSENLFIKSFSKAEVIVSPKIRDFKWKLQFKVKSNRVSINSKYLIHHENLSFFIPANNDKYIGTIPINYIDGEISILFNYFKISFIKENLFKDYIKYSHGDSFNKLNYFPNKSDYLVNIVWIFKD